MKITDTICALITPAGMGAIAVFRISGPEAITVAAQLMGKRQIVKEARSFVTVIHVGKALTDQAVVNIFRHPKSYTGEDVVEISTHGSVYIQRKMMERLCDLGCRPAYGGEFTMRAFMNGKMDLSQAEAVADIIASESEASHKMAQQQLHGAYSNKLKMMRQNLVELASLVELELDFGEEDLTFADRDKLLKLAGELCDELDLLAQSYRVGNSIREGIPVTIAGLPNAGKSSLLNALCGEDRSIVTSEPGTTRDAIDIRIAMGGFVFRFWDTAGLRDSDEKIESIGIGKSREIIGRSAIVIVVCDQSTITEEALSSLISDLGSLNKDAEIITVANKSDLNRPAEWLSAKSDCCLSCKTGMGLDDLRALLISWPERNGYNPAHLCVCGARHYHAIKASRKALDAVKEGLKENRSGELLAQDIRIALDEIGSITGEVYNDELLDTIFSRFCIGK